ncbi:hypothetical protein DENIS_2515 [Desulfonema ishimotonii]|uniref:Uncharacterized protein n=2 Tax=Desulfonema ishimotonii TaxID=45657 RepID=A0A401FX96_9BACT|nr:hypothetical protein DENIS_2515 [Desulfonema ishimotonii]
MLLFLLFILKQKIMEDKVMPTIRDWGFLEVIVGLIFGIISIILFYQERNRSRKDLRYKVLYNEPLVKVKEDDASRIKIFFDDEPANDVYWAVVKNINCGK